MSDQVSFWRITMDTVACPTHEVLVMKAKKKLFGIRADG
jgi:hypothetical protein